MKNVKTFGEFTNKSVVAKFNYADAEKDLKNIEYATTKAEKRQIADKYGIESNKIAEIKQAIYLIGNEVHKTKKPNEYTDEDFLWWWRCFNAPTTSATLKPALQNESAAWFEFILKKAEELIFKDKWGDYWVRAKNSFNKYVVGLINKDKNDNDKGYKNLMNLLLTETVDFHDRYMESVRNWAGIHFDTYRQFKDFDIYDFMCFFGIFDRNYVADIYESKDNPMAGVDEVYHCIKKFGVYFSPSSSEYISRKKTITFNNKTVKATPVRKREDFRKYWRDNNNLRDRSQYADLPSDEAIRAQTETQMLERSYKWNKKKYIDYIVDIAEKKYKHDMEAIAEKIRRMNMDEANLYVQSMQDDPIHYDIYVSDGSKTAHARSIFAAEFSVKVSPHYRFIIT